MCSDVTANFSAALICDPDMLHSKLRQYGEDFYLLLLGRWPSEKTRNDKTSQQSG
jgi:hypothetical protein